MRHTVFRSIAAGSILLATIVVPAGAVDDTKPTPCNGMAYSDKAGDNTNTAVPASFTTATTDLLGAFINNDASKGDQATTYNLVVKDLKAEVPGGYTTVAWIGYYQGKDNTLRFVRAVADFGGGVTFEYGSIQDAEATTVSVTEGQMPGKMFEGPDGVVQLVIPTSFAKAGDTLKPVYANILQGQATLPPASGSPVRGTSWVMDRAPETEAEAGVKAVIEPCSGAVAPPATTTTAPPATTPPATKPGPARALPVKLLTTSATAKKVTKTLALKLSASEKITKLGAQLRRGSKVVGKGSLTTLQGKGTLKLKVGKLAKGAYVLDLVGSDAGGARLLRSYKFRVK